MLNVRRVRHMTKMAMFEKNEGPSYSGLLNVEKKDYLSFSDVGAFIGGTLFYIVAASLGVVALVGFFVTSVDITVSLLIALFAVLGYVVFIYFYRIWMHNRALVRFDAASKKIRKLRRDYQLLEEMYEQEEEDKAPSMSLDEELTVQLP